MKQHKEKGAGMAIGTAIGIATDNLSVWIAIGVVFGAGIGNRMTKKKSQE